MGIYHLGLISPKNNANTKLNGLNQNIFLPHIKIEKRAVQGWYDSMIS